MKGWRCQLTPRPPAWWWEPGTKTTKIEFKDLFSPQFSWKTMKFSPGYWYVIQLIFRLPDHDAFPCGLGNPGFLDASSGYNSVADLTDFTAAVSPYDHPNQVWTLTHCFFTFHCLFIEHKPLIWGSYFDGQKIHPYQKNQRKGEEEFVVFSLLMATKSIRKEMR